MRTGRRTGAGLAAAALAGGLALSGPAGARTVAPVGGCPAGLPSGIPVAACGADPQLPAPTAAAWPFPDDAWSHTEGSGRLAAGAFYWTDYVYDDHGALGLLTDTFGGPGGVSDLAPSRGSYSYPGFTTRSGSSAGQGPARGNGADIFRAGVGLTPTDTYWRVDWNTLVDPRVPIAEWTFDTDDNPATGSSAWPAGAGVRSPGIDKALVVSAAGAWLVDPATGTRLPVTGHGGQLWVDRAVRSFIVRVPRALLPVSGRWRVRLAAGLADAAGTGFAPVSQADGALPGEPAVYNVTFRSYAQEPAVYDPSGGLLDAATAVLAKAGLPAPTLENSNFWMEAHQAFSLASGDVSVFSALVSWPALAARATTPEPMPSGYSNRWYVSALPLGQGVVPNDPNHPSGDLRPNYLGRIQPFAVYVPTGVDPRRSTPLTWVLHSLGVNQNQYGALAPLQLYYECQLRHTICATTEGYGPDGWYLDEAGRDFFRVWHALATSYRLDPERTTLSGYSMGGYGTYLLGLTYPDLFAEAMAQEGPPTCGIEVAPTALAPAGAGRCTADGVTTALVGNARWLPYISTSGTIDELVPASSLVLQGQAFEAAGDRQLFVELPAEDHLAYSVQNSWQHPIEELADPALTNQPAGIPQRVTDPARIDYAWYPDGQRPDWGVAPTGVYWIRGLTARTARPGQLAAVHALDGALPDPAVRVSTATSLAPWTNPSPALLRFTSWRLGPAAARTRVLMLRLVDVAAIGIDVRRAALAGSTLRVTTDGPTRLALTGLSAGTEVVTLHAGTSVVRVGAAGAVARQRAAGPVAVRGARLARTGADPAVAAVGLMVLLLGLLGRRQGSRGTAPKGSG